MDPPGGGDHQASQPDEEQVPLHVRAQLCEQHVAKVLVQEVKRIGQCSQPGELLQAEAARLSDGDEIHEQEESAQHDEMTIGLPGAANSSLVASTACICAA